MVGSHARSAGTAPPAKEESMRNSWLLAGIVLVVSGRSFAQEPAQCPAALAQAAAASAAKAAAEASCRRPMPAGEPMVVIEALCVRVPGGFLHRSGLTSGGRHPEPALTLTKREVRMLAALIEAEREKEVLSRPRLMTLDNQTAVVQIGQDVPLVTELMPSPDEGPNVYRGKVEFVHSGLTLQVTPRVGCDDKSVTLRVKADCSGLTDGVAPVPVRAALPDSGDAGEVRTAAFVECRQPAVNVQTAEATLRLKDGGTALLPGTAASGGRDGAAHQGELLWILTAHFPNGPAHGRGAQP
jgi:type II secretory pathway component GspD/PulD (secretin)